MSANINQQNGLQGVKYSVGYLYYNTTNTTSYTGKIALHNVYCTEYRVYIGGGVNAYLLGVTASTDKRKIPFMHPAIIWCSARISGHDVRVGNELGIFERIAQIFSTSTVNRLSELFNASRQCKIKRTGTTGKK